MTICKANCFIDTQCNHNCIRPIQAPNGLVWNYYNVLGSPSGTLDSRKFTPCDCGCGNLIANPPVNITASKVIINQ